jgi:alcohol dehydrogenase (NADP+)
MESDYVKTPAYAAMISKAPLVPYEVERRIPGPKDIRIDIAYCGICHSDIHQTRDEWGGATFPMVPGHEIVGRVVAKGEDVKTWMVDDVVGVGVVVDSCRECAPCKAGEEVYCSKGPSYTYNGHEQRSTTPTYGGYSATITVDQGYVMKIPKEIPPERAAPMMCAGITTYSPLRTFGVKPDQSVAIAGLGGLGHMGLKFAKAIGAKVTVLSHSPSKKDDAARLGADDFVVLDSPEAFKAHSEMFDFILDTVSAKHDYNSYMGLLKQDGTMAIVGLPDPGPVRPQILVDRRRRLVGSAAGGIKQTQEMLNFGAARGVAADVEVIPIQKVNEAFERTMRSDVKYRFVIDISSLSK